MKKLLLILITITFLGLINKPEQAIKTQRTSIDSIFVRETIYKNINIDPCIKECAYDIGTQPEYLYIVIKHESNGNPKAINPYTNAVGLIQFMPSTLHKWGYTVDSVYNMSFEEQTKLIKKYYSFYSKYNLDNPIKLSLCSFYPYALKEWNNDNYIFGSEGYVNPNKIAKQNSPLDLNKDGVITMNEYKKYYSNKLTIK